MKPSGLFFFWDFNGTEIWNECDAGCLAGSIMKLRGCDKQVWRNGKNLVGKEVP